MSWPQVVLTVILFWTLSSVSIGQESVSPEGEVTEGINTEVTFSSDLPINHNELKRLLRIRSLSGKFQLEHSYNTFRLRLDFYRNGRLIDVGRTDAGVGGAELRRYGQFNVQIVDLDYLKLGDSPAGHWRIVPQILSSTMPEGRGVIASPGNIDVPKEIFTAIPSTGGTGRFEEFPDDGNEMPLFWSASGRVKREASLESLLKSNPDSDILVGVLIVRKTGR